MKWNHDSKAMAIFLHIILHQSLLFVAAWAVDPACECIIFEESYGREFGVFTSPNFPTPYEANTHCLLYTFVGNEDEIIQLTFEDFDVQKTHLECVFGDFVKLFLHLPNAEVNEYTLWNSVLCGTMDDIETTHYSSANSLIMEFHSDWRNGNNTGFRGRYRFLNKKSFRTDGEKAVGTDCDYNFINANRSLSRGWFYSPQYPSRYLPNSRCSYRFVARPKQRIKITFEHVSLQHGDDSCLDSPDGIKIHDGGDESAPVIGHLCHMNNMVELVSTGSQFFAQFLSGNVSPGQGFKASYSFEDETHAIGFVDIPSMEADKPSTENQHKGNMLQSPLKSSAYCDMVFSSDVAKNGSVTSPNYPSPYPARVTCRYSFSGRGKERVQIIFTDFDLYKHDTDAKECQGVDAVVAFVQIDGRPERIDNFCGNQVPKQLMSNGAALTLEFHSFRESDAAPRGFKAIYRFVTNFGISTGRQDPQSVCSFIYNSNETTNGTFTSPNFPGYYPRSTECHYFFKGNVDEKVRLTFAYFDVEGVTPCSAVMASDYLEFSNYPSADRKIPRHCGLKRPSVMESENNFFRVTFRSNNIFDGTGFEAFYQFRNHGDVHTIKKIRSSSASREELWVMLSVFATVAQFHIVTSLHAY